MSDNTQSPRIWVIRFLFLAVGLTIVGRLFSLQLIDDKYKVMANDQAIYRKVVYPARGVIVDRKGKTLMFNNITYDLLLTPNKMAKDMDTALFCNLMEMTPDAFKKAVDKVINKNGHQRQGVFLAQLSEAQNARLQENLYLFPGFEMTERTTRSYPKPIGAHIFGYIAEVSPSMLEKPRYASYTQGDYLGITGLENVYEEVLRGQRGVQYLVRDVLNRPRDSYKDGILDTPAVGGKTLELYLDADLQEYAEKLMKGKIGSAIAIDPKTGGILAMVSAPGFDPNLLSGADRSKNIAALFADYTTPMFNRAIQSQYPPGSTFKPLTALIGLDVGAITPAFGMSCGGGYYACGRRIGCTHSGGGHAANLRLAMANSCNSYFCHVFRLTVDKKDKYKNVRVGLEAWHDYLYNFGLTHPLGVDITGEKGGNVPDSSYFNKIYNGNWNSCNMVVVGMGQGELTMTPMQMANVMCIIANRGYFYTPHFVKTIGGSEKDTLLKKYQTKHEVTHIPSNYYQAVIDGMEDVVVHGTGRVAQLPNTAVCGKTGTVENFAIINGKEQKLDNHSVFVCFAPKDDPKIAIAVVVQNSGYGATWAGPVASLMMEKYLTDSVKRAPLQERMFNAHIVKPYIKILDSMQRQKDRARELLKYGDRRAVDSLKRLRDTTLVKNILTNYFNVKSAPARRPDPIKNED